MIALIGTTGTGKSTTMQYFAGSEMGYFELFGKDYSSTFIGPLRIYNQGLVNAKVSPRAISETTTATSLSLDLSNLKGFDPNEDTL